MQVPGIFRRNGPQPSIRFTSLSSRRTPLQGLFLYDGNSQTMLTGWVPDNVVEWSEGVAVDFGAGKDLFSFSGTVWTMLTGWDPQAMISASFNQ